MEEDFTKDDILARWLSGELSPAEEKRLRERSDFAEYERLVQGVDELHPPAYDAKAALQRLKATRANTPATAAPARVRQLPNVRWLVGVAAGVLVLLTAWFLWPGEDAITKSTGPGATASVELPDGSSVRLNAASQFSFDTKDNTRMAELEGEGYFEVQKSEQPFVVQTALGEVTVLGTTFVVFQREDQLRVSCTSGRVAVEIFGADTTFTLTPGASVEWQEGAVATTPPVNETEALDWLAGRSVFQDRPLGEVLAEMERQFDVEFVVPPSLEVEQLINTSFSHENIDLALQITLATIPEITYDYDSVAKRVTLSLE